MTAFLRVIDVKHGTEITRNEDGSVIGETPWVNGKIHGTTIKGDQGGTVIWRLPYVNGVKHGKEVAVNLTVL